MVPGCVTECKCTANQCDIRSRTITIHIKDSNPVTGTDAWAEYPTPLKTRKQRRIEASIARRKNRKRLK